MSEYVIEKGVPLPREDYYNGRPGARRPFRPRVPWGDMQPGDSVFVPYKPGVDRLIDRNGIQSNAIRWSHLNTDGKAQFAARAEPEGVRVWRIDGTEWERGDG